MSFPVLRSCFQFGLFLIGNGSEYTEDYPPFLFPQLPDVQAVSFHETLVAVVEKARVPGVSHIRGLKKSDLRREFHREVGGRFGDNFLLSDDRRRAVTQ